MGCCAWSQSLRRLKQPMARKVCYGPFLHRRRSPPPSVPLIPLLWMQLPAANRQRLLWLLSQLVERQIPMTRREEESNERNGR